MAAIDFVLFTIVSGVNAYLPLFLRLKSFSATEIGFLLGIFNMAGILVPLLLTPITNRKGRLNQWMFYCSTVMVFTPFLIFYSDGFLVTAVAMAVFAGFYKYAIPLTDSLIVKSLGDRQDRYGMVRMAGTAGFIVMSLIMQRFVRLDSISTKGMVYWFSFPAMVLSLSVLGKTVCDNTRRTSAEVDGEGCPRCLDDEAEREGLSPLNAESENGEGCPRCEPAPEAASTQRNEVPPSTGTLLKSFGPEFYLMLFVMFMQYLGMVPANQFLSMYATEKLGADISGLLWAVNSIFELPFMFFSGWFIKKFGDKKLIVLCTFAVSVRLLIYAFVQNVAGCILGQCFHSLTFGLFFPASVAYCTRKSQFHESARILSFALLNGVTGLPVVIGASAGGVIIDTLGYQMLFILFSVVPAVACLAYMLVNPFISRKEKVEK